MNDNSKKNLLIIGLILIACLLVVLCIIVLNKNNDKENINTVDPVIEENKKLAAAESSALGYIDAIEKYMLLSEVDDSLLKIEPGTYSVDQLIELGVDQYCKGDKPNNSGTIIINIKGSVDKADLIFGDYKVHYNGAKATAIHK